MRFSFFSILILATIAVASPVLAGSAYKPHLPVVGFDPLGEPATGLNTEIAVDAVRKFAYVGSFGGENTVKAVDVSDPANPTLTDAEPVPAGELWGPINPSGNFPGVFVVQPA